MKDIPMFTTDYGVASLILKEIPYRKRAYVKIQSTLEPEKLLEECVGFCRACGAERVDASGHEYLEKYPLVTEMWQMTCAREVIEETDACLFPMTEQTMARWLEIYNQRMADVPNAAYLDEKDGREFLAKGDCYFVHKNGKLLGIGKAAGDCIDTVIATEPGMGQTVMQALSKALTGETIRVTVARENARAVKLYQRMGFVQTKILSRWHQIF